MDFVRDNPGEQVPEETFTPQFKAMVAKTLIGNPMLEVKLTSQHGHTVTDSG